MPFPAVAALGQAGREESSIEKTGGIDRLDWQQLCALAGVFGKGPGPGVTQQSSDQFPGNGVTGWLGVGATKLGPCQRAGLDAVGHLVKCVIPRHRLPAIADAAHGLLQAIRVIVEVLERGSFGTDVTAAEDVVLVASDGDDLLAFDFDFEKFSLTKDEYKDLIYEEIMLYHSDDAAQNYITQKSKHPEGCLHFRFGENKFRKAFKQGDQPSDSKEESS